jgi:hypothetical protein
VLRSKELEVIKRTVAVLALTLSLLLTGTAVGQVQTVTVLNQAGIRPARLAKVERAIVAQSSQVSVSWSTPTIVFAPGGWKVYLKTGRDLSGLNVPWGFHANPVGPTGVNLPITIYQPYSIVYTYGTSWETWSSILSHELIEMLVDPYQHRAITWGASSYSVQACDAVKQDAYRFRAVNLADYTLPSFWSDGPPPWDFRHLLNHPWRPSDANDDSY